MEKKQPRSDPPDTQARSRSAITLATPFECPVLSAGSLLAGASRHEATVVVRLIGSADFTHSAQLDAFLMRVHAESVRLGVGLAVLDLRKLEFMNSSCLKSLTTWICAVAELPEIDQYRFRFESNPSIHWQSRSLHAVRNLAPHLIDLEEAR